MVLESTGEFPQRRRWQQNANEFSILGSATSIENFVAVVWNLLLHATE